MREVKFFEDTDDLSYIIENRDKLNKEALDLIKKDYKDYTELLDLFEKVKDDIDFKEFITLKRFLIVLYNLRDELDNSFNFEDIKNIIIQLKVKVREDNESEEKEYKVGLSGDNVKLKKKVSPQEIRKIQSDRIKRILKGISSDEQIIDKYMEEILSINKPRTFEKITEKEIVSHFKFWKDFEEIQ